MADWWSTPNFKQFAGNVLSDIGYGLANSTNLGNAFGVAANRQQELDPAREAYRQSQEEKARRESTLATAINNLRTKYGAPDLADMVESGGLDVSSAWNEVLRRQSPGEPMKGIEINGRLVNPVTGELIGDYRDAGGGSVPSGYRTTTDGNLEFIPGGPADPANKKTSISPTAQKELFDAEDAAQAGENVLTALDRALELNTQTRSGWGAGGLATVGANLPDWIPGLGGNEAQDAATLELQNIVTANALESLKATFGAAPTEGERKILLEIQGSVDQPAPVREAIFKRARAAAERRLAFNRDKAARIRSGTYFTEQGGIVGGTLDGGGDWSYTP